VKVRTVLEPEKQSLIPGIGCSIFMHGGVLTSALLFSVITARCGPQRPIIDLNKTMEVSMMSLPKSQLNVPDRAQRAPVPKGSDAPKTDNTPPPVESDLAFKTEDAVEDAGVEQAREQMMAELERQRLLDDLMAPTGATDRDATDPNSTTDATINASGAAMRGDPEFAAYIAKIQRLFMQVFKPLGAVTSGNPDLVCSIYIVVDTGTGRIDSWEVLKTSGVASYDAAAERAVAQVGTIPLPPEKFLSLVGEGYAVNFRPP
jgi:outer membrane biosynthesis protein TonB